MPTGTPTAVFLGAAPFLLFEPQGVWLWGLLALAVCLVGGLWGARTWRRWQRATKQLSVAETPGDVEDSGSDEGLDRKAAALPAPNPLVEPGAGADRDRAAAAGRARRYAMREWDKYAPDAGSADEDADDVACAGANPDAADPAEVVVRGVGGGADAGPPPGGALALPARRTARRSLRMDAALATGPAAPAAHGVDDDAPAVMPFSLAKTHAGGRAAADPVPPAAAQPKIYRESHREAVEGLLMGGALGRPRVEADSDEDEALPAALGAGSPKKPKRKRKRSSTKGPRAKAAGDRARGASSLDNPRRKSHAKGPGDAGPEADGYLQEAKEAAKMSPTRHKPKLHIHDPDTVAGACLGPVRGCAVVCTGSGGGPSGWTPPAPPNAVHIGVGHRPLLSGWLILYRGSGGGGWVRGQKKVCVPKIDLQVRAPL